MRHSGFCSRLIFLIICLGQCDLAWGFSYYNVPSKNLNLANFPDQIAIHPTNPNFALVAVDGQGLLEIYLGLSSIVVMQNFTYKNNNFTGVAFCKSDPTKVFALLYNDMLQLNLNLNNV